MVITVLGEQTRATSAAGSRDHGFRAPCLSHTRRGSETFRPQRHQGQTRLQTRGCFLHTCVWAWGMEVCSVPACVSVHVSVPMCVLILGHLQAPYFLTCPGAERREPPPPGGFSAGHGLWDSRKQRCGHR